MKTFIISILTLLCVATASAQTQQNPVEGSIDMKLLWNPNPPSDFVTFYTVYVTGANGTAKVVVAGTSLGLLTVFAGLPNGLYKVDLTATNKGKRESAHSLPIWIFWYGNPPSAPEQPKVEFTQGVSP